MRTLTSRERVARTLAHQEPDLVPIDIGGTACWFQDTAYERMKGHLGIDSTGDLFRLGENAGAYDEMLLDHLDTDFRHVYLHPSQPEWDAWHASDQTEFVDDWGILRRKILSDFGGHNWERITYPLANATEADLDSYPWPDPSDPPRVAGLASALGASGRPPTTPSRRAPSRTACSRQPGSAGHGTIHGGHVASPTLCTQAATPDSGCSAWPLRRLAGRNRLLRADRRDGRRLRLADRPALSPRIYRQFIQPYRLELNRLIRSKAANARIQHHTCGSVYKLLPDLIATEIDVLNPVQPLAADMDPHASRLSSGAGSPSTARLTSSRPSAARSRMCAMRWPAVSVRWLPAAAISWRRAATSRPIPRRRTCWQ